MRGFDLSFLLTAEHLEHLSREALVAKCRQVNFHKAIKNCFSQVLALLNDCCFEMAKIKSDCEHLECETLAITMIENHLVQQTGTSKKRKAKFNFNVGRKMSKHWKNE